MSRTIVFIIFFYFNCNSYHSIEVKVKQGTLYGIQEETVYKEKPYFAFYGVPYARPPVKELRFKNPKVYKKWSSPINGMKEYRGACAQLHIVHKHGLYGTEDCLYLNIYTPHIPKDDSQRLKAVMIWIHGYAYTSSFSHIQGADFLIENDVLFITLTHRIGLFGFLKFNETDNHTNMGLRDIVVALKWIRRNVKHFGGDKNKITLMGSGSASTFISLLTTTKARKLFSKIILQSGSIFSPSILQGDHVLEKNRLIDNLKKTSDDSLMTADIKKLITASQKIYNNKDVINFQRPVVPFSPLIEEKTTKSLLNIKPKDFFREHLNPNKTIPILIGFNTQESISEAIPFIRNTQYLKMLQIFKFMIPFIDGCQYNYTTNEYKDIASKIKWHYFKESISEKDIGKFLKYSSDLQKYPIVKFIKSYLEATNSELFVYKFNYVGKLNTVKMTSLAGSNVGVRGAASGDEICYIMKCEPAWETYVNMRDHQFDSDRIITNKMAKLWTNFAKFGNPTPNNEFNLTWLPMTTNKKNVLLIDKEIKLIDFKSEEKLLNFYDEIYEDHYSRHNCYKKSLHDEL